MQSHHKVIWRFSPRTAHLLFPKYKAQKKAYYGNYQLYSRETLRTSALWILESAGAGIKPNAALIDVIIVVQGHVAESLQKETRMSVKLRLWNDFHEKSIVERS